MLYAQVHLTLPAWIHSEIAADTPYPDDTARMALAVRLSELNVREQSGGPFGAALFTDDGRLLGVGVNRVVPSNCSVAHAEMMAFATAQQSLSQFRLNQTGEKIVLATSSQARPSRDRKMPPPPSVPRCRVQLSRMTLRFPTTRRVGAPLNLRSCGPMPRVAWG